MHSRCFDCIIFTSHFQLIVTWPLFQDCMRRVRSELITQVMSSISLSDCCIALTAVDTHTVEHASKTKTTIIQSGELNHALSQVGGPTQHQLSRPMSSGHHISMEHRLRRKHLLLNTNTKARSSIHIEKKKKKETFLKKNRKKREIGKMKKKE